jgi:pimeloyl-ACP methyl ester carboxylesterase
MDACATQGRLSRAQRVGIPGASHIMDEDNPDAFRDAVLSCLASQRAA